MAKTEWDNRYLAMAELVASWSKDPNAKVGAVIVRNNRVIATGFNGFPTGVLDLNERLSDKNLKLEMVVHAEENALIVAGKGSEGATIYVYGKPVCPRCAASIIQSGISRVVAEEPGESATTKDLPVFDAPPEKKIDWNELGRISIRMFSETHIQFHGVKPPERAKPSKAPAGIETPPGGDASEPRNNGRHKAGRSAD